MTTPKTPTDPTIRDRKGGPIYATDGTRSRANRVFEDLCMRARDRGFQVTIPMEGFMRGTFLEKDGHLIEVYVRETQHERVVDRRRVHKATGRLAFCIGDVYVASGGGFGSRGIVWKDGLRVKLENKIDKILVRIEEEYAYLREWDQRRASNAQAEAERARQAEETRRREEEERARFDQLVRQVESWGLSNRIRAFVDEAERSLLEVHGQIEAGSEAAEWFQWARKRADLADPLRRIR